MKGIVGTQPLSTASSYCDFQTLNFMLHSKLSLEEVIRSKVLVVLRWAGLKPIVFVYKMRQQEPQLHLRQPSLQQCCHLHKPLYLSNAIIHVLTTGCVFTNPEHVSS